MKLLPSFSLTEKHYSKIQQVIGWLFLLMAVFVSLQSIARGSHINESGFFETGYNNYLIFKTSFIHLLDGKDLYSLHPADHFDYYKYSPTFALLMAPFSILPNWLGLSIWNVLNVAVWTIAIRRIPGFTNKAITGLLLICIHELIGSTMNDQSNTLMTGLILLGVILMERNQPLWATLLLMLSVYIKVYSVVFFMVVLFYPDRLKSVLYSLGWFILLGILPLMVINFEQLIFQYKSWGALLGSDYDASYGYSVMGILSKWFHLDVLKDWVIPVGTLLIVMPALRYKLWSNIKYRWLMVAALLIWVIIFNHKAESPTFIVAITGIALWYNFNRRRTLNIVLLVLTLVFVCFIYTDIIPYNLRWNFFHPYFIKVVPCIIIWGKLLIELLNPKFEMQESFV